MHSFPPGTIGHCFENRGSPLSGIAATFGNTTLTIQDTFLEWRATLPNSNEVIYGVVIEVALGERHETIVLKKSDHYGNVYELLHKKIEVHETPLREQLAEWARMYADYFAAGAKDPITWVLNEHTELPKLLGHLLMAPRPGSLVAWAQTELRETSFPPITAKYRGHTITLRSKQYAPPSESFSAMESTLAFAVEIDPPRETTDSFWGEPWMSLGSLEDEWLERPGPTSEKDHAYVELLLEKWHADTSYYFEYALKKNGFGCLSGMHWQFDMPKFWIFDLLTYYLEHGPPPEPPVPAFSGDDIARTAKNLQKASETTQQDVARLLAKNTSASFAVYEVHGYTIVLADDTSRPIPFYAFSILLRPPGSDHFVTILLNDVWNPQAARVIDGDVFAFRRFVEWLRLAIKKNHLNERIVFEGEDEDSEKIKKTSVWISDWLLFGRPEPKEELFVDWRCQHYVAVAGPKRGIICFAGIYGFGAEDQARIVNEDIPAWRKFLQDVIDARFAYAWG